MMNDVKDVRKDGNHRSVDDSMMVVEHNDREMNDDQFTNDRVKRLICDLQRHWLTDYQQSREKLLVEMTERVSYFEKLISTRNYNTNWFVHIVLYLIRAHKKFICWSTRRFGLIPIISSRNRFGRKRENM